jgi:hypothetical protein
MPFRHAYEVADMNCILWELGRVNFVAAVSLSFISPVLDVKHSGFKLKLPIVAIVCSPVNTSMNAALMVFKKAK